MEQNVERQNHYLSDIVANSFTWSIISMFFCGSGLLGLIFAIVARSKAKNLLSIGAEEVAMVKASNNLSKIALIVSIVMMVLAVLSLIIIISTGALVANQFANMNF